MPRPNPPNTPTTMADATSHISEVGMNLESLKRSMQEAALRAAAARRQGDYYDADYWGAEAERYSDRIEYLERQAEWAELADNKHG